MYQNFHTYHNRFEAPQEYFLYHNMWNNSECLCACVSNSVEQQQDRREFLFFMHFCWTQGCLPDCISVQLRAQYCLLFWEFIYIIKGVMFVCLSVCLYLCSIWLAKRLGRSRPNLTHALMSTQGVFLSRSFMYACRSDRITKHPECCAKATPGERLRNSVQLE